MLAASTTCAALALRTLPVAVFPKYVLHTPLVDDMQGTVTSIAAKMASYSWISLVQLRTTTK